MIERKQLHMSIYTPKNKTIIDRDSQGESNPSEHILNIIRQYARNSHVEKRLHLPDNILFKN